MKWLLAFLALLTILALTATIGVGFFLSPQSKLEKSDAIVAISGGETAERIEEAVDLYKANYAPVLIFSGAARDEGTSNAQAMKLLAIKAGVPEENIFVEEKAQDTFENARFVREHVDSKNIKSIILVTSPYHQRRAYLTFRRFLGEKVKIINHSSTDSAWRKNGWWKDEWGKKLTFSELQKIILLPIVFGLTKG